MSELYRLTLQTGLSAAKPEYAPGETVTVWNLFTMTDMRYTFYVNAPGHKQVWENGRVGVRFVMPAHDVEVKLGAESCMTAPPPLKRPFGLGMMAGVSAFWTCPDCGERTNRGKFCTNCGAKKPG